MNHTEDTNLLTTTHTARLRDGSSRRTARSGPPIGVLLALALVAGSVLVSCGTSGPARGAAKSCVACHEKTRQQTRRGVVHAPFADESGCAICHKRHGVVGALVLKSDEKTLCLGCHAKEAEALKRAHVHAALD
jgi:predicted CXXCH cytochrome family protein